MASPPSPAAIPPSSSIAVTPPLASSSPPSPTTTPPPTAPVVTPPSSPIPLSPPVISPPPMTPAPPPASPSTPPPSTTSPPVIVPPRQPSVTPPTVPPPQPALSPPIVPPPQPSASPPTESPPSLPIIPSTPLTTNGPPPSSPLVPSTPPITTGPPPSPIPPSEPSAPPTATSSRPPANSFPPPPSTKPPEPSPPAVVQPPSNLSSPPVTQPPHVSPPPQSVKVSPSPPANSSTPLTPNSPTIKPIPPTTSSNDSTNTAQSNIGNDGNRGGVKPGEIAGIGVGVAVALVLVALIFWCMRKKKNVGGYAGGFVMPSSVDSQSHMSESAHQLAPLVKTSSSSQGYPYSPPEPGLGNSRSWFTYDELSAITNGFSPQNLLGEGGFGCVYKGRLSDGRDVAVKQLKVGGGQGEREFQAEVEIISRVHHRHLVSLVGYCISDNQRLLVYDYVPNNTLHYHLHSQERTVLDWATRVKIAAGAARGIAYLHEDCHPRIIHRDIKSSNILLDNSFEAQVSDFGLAKLTADAQTHVTTRVMGTFGYLAPEYASSGKLTDRSDVFSFGVVLLELITGRKPVDASQPMGDESLVEWARPLMSQALETKHFEDLPDLRLQGSYNESEMFRMIETAAACVRHSAPMRPRMGLVMRALNNLADNLDLDNGVRPGQSELFNTGTNSAEIRIFQRMAFGAQDYSSDFSHGSWSSQRDL